MGLVEPAADGEVEDDEEAVPVVEGPVGRVFTGEFVDGAIGVLRDFVFPSLLARGTVREVVAAASKVRGWNFTVAALLEAVFDLLRRKGLPDVLDAWPVAPLARVPVGISLPLFDTPDEAAARVEQAVAAGYRRIKLKVAPGMNLDTLAAARSAFPSMYLGFDANGACTEDDQSFLDVLAAFEPAFLEQPFAPDRLDLCTALKEHRPALKLCLDESIDALGDLITAHRLGALDELNREFVRDRADVDIGLDTKVVLRDSLVLDITLNPDFSQVESDEPQVTVNQRFEVFFPEKRPFFLENASFFATPINLVFTRRIADPQMGVRLTGKVGNTAIGVLFTDDQAPGRVVTADDPLFGKRARIGILRISHDILERPAQILSHLGLSISRPGEQHADGGRRAPGRAGLQRTAGALRT